MKKLIIILRKTQRTKLLILLVIKADTLPIVQRTTLLICLVVKADTLPIFVSWLLSPGMHLLLLDLFIEFFAFDQSMPHVFNIGSGVSS